MLASMGGRRSTNTALAGGAKGVEGEGEGGGVGGGGGALGMS